MLGLTMGNPLAAAVLGLPAQPEHVKDLNRALILAIVRQERILSRAAIARQSGLSKVTASALVDDLVRSGILHERGSGKSSGGRPPQLLEYVPEARLAVGVEFAHGEVVGAVTDLDSRPVQTGARRVLSADAGQVLDTVGDLVEDLLRPFPRERVLGLGFASPGLVDVNSGTIRQAIDVGWQEVPASQILSDRLGLPVTVANRSKAAALAERWYAPPTGNEHQIYVVIGSGLAAGVVHGESLYLGATSGAGELGHVTVVPDGPVCECGNRGCLHVYAGEEAIARRARELGRLFPEGWLEERDCDFRQITADAVIDAALNGNPRAVQVIQEAARYLGIALANVVNLFNPDAIVIGGPTSRAGTVLLDGVKREIRCRALSGPARHVTIALSQLGSLAGAVGAAILVLRQANQLIFRQRIPPLGNR